MTEDKIWFVVREKRADGPYMRSEILQQIDDGALTYSDFAFRQGLSGWTQIKDCPEFERRTREVPAEISNTGVDIPKDNSIEGWIVLRKDPNSPEGKEIQSGPFSTEVVRQQLHNKELSFDDRVWKSGYVEWKVIGELEDFDRRRPEDLKNLTPKPEFAAAEVKPIIKAENAMSFIAPIPSDDSSHERSYTSKTHVPVPNMAGEDEPTGFWGTLLNRFQPTIIVGMGVTLGMVVTFVALRAYFSESRTRAQLALIKPAQPVAAIPVPEKPAIAPVNPEIQRPPANLPKQLTLKVIDKRRLKVAVEANLEGNTPLTYTFSAKPGDILSFRFFSESGSTKVTAGQLTTIESKFQNLPAGTYTVTVKGGDLQASENIFVGDKTPSFDQLRENHKELVLKQKQREERQIDTGIKFVEKSMDLFSTQYKRISKKPKATALRDWRKLTQKWAAQAAAVSRPLKDVKPSRKFEYVYPDQLVELGGYLDRVKNLSTIYEKRFKQSRKLASEPVPTNKLQSAVEDFKKRWSGLDK